MAQKNEWGIGIRGGEPTGVTIKKYFGENALDITIGRNGWGHYRGRKYWKGEYRSSVVVLVNYLWQQEISGVEGLDYYYGLGGQLGSRRYWDRDEKEERETFGLGVTGALGIEYFIPDTPISAFAELGPYFELTPAIGWLWFDGGGGVRINF